MEYKQLCQCCNCGGYFIRTEVSHLCQQCHGYKNESKTDGLLESKPNAILVVRVSIGGCQRVHH